MESRGLDAFIAQVGSGGTGMEWRNNANCLGLDPGVFFPEGGVSTREAREVCGGCAVRGECLDYALANGEEYGIWGGMTEWERRRFRRLHGVARSGATVVSGV